MKKLKNITQSLFVGFISFLMLWELFFLFLNTRTIPSPVETIAYMFIDPWKLFWHCTASLLRVGTAVGISLIIGIPAGIMLGINKVCKRLFSPLLYFIYPIPKVAFLPVFMLLFGLGNTSKIILVIWIIIFQIMLSVRDGVERFHRYI